MSNSGRRTIAAPIVILLAVVVGVAATFLMDLFLLWWAALIIGVTLAFALVAALAPYTPDESRIGADGPKEEGTPLHNVLVVPMSLILAVAGGLVSAWVLDLQLLDESRRVLDERVAVHDVGEVRAREQHVTPRAEIRFEVLNRLAARHGGLRAAVHPIQRAGSIRRSAGTASRCT